MSPAARRTSSAVMVGRARELDTIVDLAADLRPGQPAVTLVAGRAGMGKTRLVSEAATRWRQQGLRVLVGGCAPVEGMPYAPLISALRGVLPEGTPVLRMLASERATSRTQLFESLSAATNALSARDPLILVAEDLHWSDRATRDALTYLVTHSGAGRLGGGRNAPVRRAAVAARTGLVRRRGCPSPAGYSGLPWSRSPSPRWPPLPRA